MSEPKFYPLFSSGWWSNVGRAIRGKGNGKFRHSISNPIRFLGDKSSIEENNNKELLEVAMDHFVLNSVLSKGADLFSLGKVKHVKEDGTEVENSKVVEFLKQPNPLQTLKGYLYQFYIYDAIYARSFQHKVLTTSYNKLPAALWLLPDPEIKINITGKMYRQTKLEEIIESFEIKKDGSKFETDRVIFMFEGIGDMMTPQSKVKAMQIPLSNLMAAGKSLNKIWTEKGPNGFVVPESIKDDTSAMMLDPEENKRVSDKWREEYDLDSRGAHVNFPGIPMKWVPIGFNVGELRFSEEGEIAFGQILDAYNYDRDLFSSTKGATFENKAAGQRLTIQNALQPVADRLGEQWTKHFIETPGERLIFCYDHLPCMQEDELKRAQTMQAENAVLSQRFRDGVLSSIDYAEAGEFELSENAPLDGTQANLRGLVGGITGALAVNQFVAQQFINPEVGVELLVAFYGYSEEDARKRITTLKVEPTAAPPKIPSGGAAAE